MQQMLPPNKKFHTLSHTISVTPVHLRCVILSYSVEVVCMANKDIVVIGASYGGIEALKVLVSGLPEGFSCFCFPCAAQSFDCSRPVAPDIDEGRAAPGVFPGGF